MLCRKLPLILIVALCPGRLHCEEPNLLLNPSFERINSIGKPLGYEFNGDAIYSKSLGNPRLDANGSGVALDCIGFGGAVSQTVAINPAQGRAFQFKFRGLPQDGFNVGEDGLSMKVEFLGNVGRTTYDGKLKQLFPIIQQARRDLAVNGNGRIGGAAVWRDYSLNFYVPFPQVDRVRLTVLCKGGGEAVTHSNQTVRTVPDRRSGGYGRGLPAVHIETGGHAFFVAEFCLNRLPEPILTSSSGAAVVTPRAGALFPLGGRWFYNLKPGESHAPATFDHTNAERLLYREGAHFETPFAGNMSATLHAGDEDSEGDIVTADRLLPDNVTVRFDAESMILHTHGIPNHPTGRFPGVNPSAIKEQDDTYYIPLVPKENPGHVALDSKTFNGALNMGPIGVAANGVVFYNPYDAGRMDATDLMDRCCGHPNPGGQYHYHKYPICLNSPWADEGTAHSPLLGWAFDGFPIYGPYESANVMAKDMAGAGALNAFNIHYDPDRGWHYHVTPGKFPYIIGGYWGKVDSRNVRPPRGRGGPQGGGPPPDGFPPMPPGFGGGPP